ncbi:MAG: hypothetical protein RLZZ531_1947 [Bacteroidota bacterium]
MKWIYLIMVLLVFTSCKPRKKKCSRGYDIDHPVSVYPVKEIYSIGDTIWFEMNIPDVFDLRGINNFTGEKFNKTVQLKDFQFYPTFIPFKKITDTTINLTGNEESGWPSFEAVYLPEYTQYEIYFGVQYVYKYINSHYRYKLGIICKEKGRFVYLPTFTFFVPMACLGSLNEQDLTPECEREIVTDIRFPINKQANGTNLTNYHLFEQFMNPALENDLDHIKEECFTFVVN